MDFWLGRWPLASAEAAEAIELSEQPGLVAFRAWALVPRARIEAGRGRGREAREAAFEAIEAARVSGSEVLSVYGRAAPSAKHAYRYEMAAGRWLGALAAAALFVLPSPASAAADGVLVFASDRSGETIGLGGGDLFALNANGSGLVRLTTSPHGEDSDPAWAPDGRRIAFIRTSDFSQEPSLTGTLHVANADGTGLRRLSSVDGAGPAWSPDGGMIAFTAHDYRGGVYVVPVDGGSTKAVAGEGHWGATWSPAGDRLAFGGDERIVLADRAGSIVGEIAMPGLAPVGLAWSPDGSRIAFVDDRGAAYVVRFDGSSLERIATPGHSLEDVVPTWSPDGQLLAFADDEGVWVANADGLDKRRLTPGLSGVEPTSPVWSPGGTELAFVRERFDGSHERDIFVVDVDGRNLRQLTRAFPDGGDNDPPSWTAGTARGGSPTPRPPQMLDVTPSRAHARRFAVDELAADGERALSLAGAYEVWSTPSNRRRYFSWPCDTYLQEATLAGTTAAASCYEETNTLNFVELFVSTASHPAPRRALYADPAQGSFACMVMARCSSSTRPGEASVSRNSGGSSVLAGSCSSADPRRDGSRTSTRDGSRSNDRGAGSM